MSIEQLQSLAGLPVQALLVIAVAVLWRSYDRVQSARVEDLKVSYEKNLADLRTRVHLLEDHAGMPHPMVQNSSQKGAASVFPVKDHKLD